MREIISYIAVKEQRAYKCTNSTCLLDSLQAAKCDVNIEERLCQ